MVCDELVKGVELDDPEEVLKCIISQHAEMLDVQPCARLHAVWYGMVWYGMVWYGMVW